MVQINNSFAGQNYFPYSLGFLQAYAQKHLTHKDEFEFLLPFYKRITVAEVLKDLLNVDIIFFSTYIWNFNISSEIAKAVKKNNQDIITVFGGCQVPGKDIKNFLKENAFIDIACYGEGEKIFLSILENCREGKWSRVPSISYVEDGVVIRNPISGRITDLKQIPSPYLSGVFDLLMAKNHQETWLGLWETNRGCPFNCSYCEWGGAYYKKMYVHELEKLFEEIDWFSKNKVEFIFCCDSNFGLLSRDLKIVERMAKNKEKYGYPKAFSVQNTKNSADSAYHIQKVLSKAGLSKGVNLAFQSLNEKTLKAIGRKNINFETFHELQRRFNNDSIETFSDIILGLPYETYESFVDGVLFLINHGQHNRIQFNNLSVLANSEMADLEYQKQHGFFIRETKLINIHGSLTDGGIEENQKLVVGTKAMPPEDWVKSRVFGWMVSLLYFNKLLQIPFTILDAEYSTSYRELFNAFLQANSGAPILHDIDNFFITKAEDIQNGGAEFCQSKQWLNIWWPADELMFIELCTKGKLDNFYAESTRVVSNLLKQKNIKYNDKVLTESISLNKNLIKLPFQNDNLKVTTDYNIWEIYRAHLVGKSVAVKQGHFSYLINRKNEKWDSWEEWCQKVVWYGNKKGAYLYPITPMN